MQSDRWRSMLHARHPDLACRTGSVQTGPHRSQRLDPDHDDTASSTRRSNEAGRALDLPGCDLFRLELHPDALQIQVPEVTSFRETESTSKSLAPAERGPTRFRAYRFTERDGTGQARQYMNTQSNAKCKDSLPAYWMKITCAAPLLGEVLAFSARRSSGEGGMQASPAVATDAVPPARSSRKSSPA